MDKLLIGTLLNSPFKYDALIEVQLELDTKPDRELIRLNDTEDGIRDATPEEKVVFDNNILTQQAASAFSQKDKRFLRDVLYDIDSRLRGLEIKHAINISVFTKALKDLYKNA